MKTAKPAALRRAVTVLVLLLSAAVLVLAVLSLLGRLDYPARIILPLLGLTELGQAFLQWQKNRAAAYFFLGAGAFVLICAAVVWFLP